MKLLKEEGEVAAAPSEQTDRSRKLLDGAKKEHFMKIKSIKGTLFIEDQFAALINEKDDAVSIWVFNLDNVSISVGTNPYEAIKCLTDIFNDKNREKEAIFLKKVFKEIESKKYSFPTYFPSSIWIEDKLNLELNKLKLNYIESAPVILNITPKMSRIFVNEKPLSWDGIWGEGTLIASMDSEEIHALAGELLHKCYLYYSQM